MESNLAVTLILSVLLASWISDCEGFVGPFPTDGKRLLQKTGNLPASLTYMKWYTQTEDFRVFKFFWLLLPERVHRG